MSDDLVKQAIAELQDVVRCRCHPAFADRGLHDPDCECDSEDAVKVLSDRIDGLEADLAKAVEATETMLDRYLLYCGGKDMPFAGHTDQKIVESVRAALAELMDDTDDDK